MSKQITKAILDSVVTKAINAAVSRNNSPKKKKSKASRGRKQQNNNNGSNNNNAYVASSVAARNMEPRFLGTTSSHSRIQHEELCGVILGSDPFTVQKSFRLNPGLSGTFPWLSTQARSWERYRFNSLSFYYKTRAGTSTIGSVIMAPDYDPSDHHPANEQIMSTYQGYTEDAPWKTQSTILSRSELNKVRYTRSSDIASGMSIADYDVGNMFVATSGFANANACGKIYVKYDVEFTVPMLDNVEAGEPATILLNNDGGNLSAAAPFGNSTLRSVDNSIITFTIDAKNLTINNLIPGVEYFLSIQINGTGLGTLVPAVFTHGTSYFSSTDALSGTTQYHLQYWFTPSANWTTVTVSVDFAATTVTFAMISIAQADLKVYEG